MTGKKSICLAFGNAVRQYRYLLGVSQEALAEKASIHRTYVGGIERGERNPTLTTIYRLASVLNVDAADLLREAGDTERKEPDE